LASLRFLLVIELGIRFQLQGPLLITNPPWLSKAAAQNASLVKLFLNIFHLFFENIFRRNTEAPCRGGRLYFQGCSMLSGWGRAHCRTFPD
jgi:hypothetical protein